jgi:TRAP-type mannitol/chloroaromatic compound transport system substrate-binding protein
MDRRGFLKTTSAAAVAAGAASAATPAAAGEAAPIAAPAIASGVRQLTLTSWHGGDLAGLGTHRLVRSLETATDGRCRIVAAADAASSDLTYGFASRHAGLHRAFQVFAGLPLSQGLDAPAQLTWLAVGGGAMLWDELAAQFGFKPLVVGHTGPSAGLWAAARLEALADLAGARFHVEGLAGDVVRALGAMPVTLDGDNVRLALADGRLDAVEWLGPLAAVPPDLRPPAPRLYHPGLNRHGLLLSLAVAKPVWDAMSPADQAIFEACAAQEYQLSLADAAAHVLIAAQVEAPAKWPVRRTWAAGLGAAFERAAEEAVEAMAATDPASRRIHDSYRAFRRMLDEAAAA